jgi:quinol monooxygenase YgiN
MIVKHVTVYLKPGHLEQFLAAQEVWNRETRKAPGYLGGYCGRSAEEPHTLILLLYWRSRADLDKFMAGDHDRVAALARADEHYERIEVHVLDAALPVSTLPPGLLAESALEAADVHMWSQAFRATAVLRTAVRLRLFDKLSAGPKPPDELAASLDVSERLLKRLLAALCAMGLVDRNDLGWSNTGLADRTLVSTAPAYQGNMILQCSCPRYVERWSTLGEQFGLPPDKPDPADDHAGFVRAMADTAAAGQADALIAAADLAGCKTLLDVGGALGPYSVALCRAHPKLSATILDLPETVPLAEQAIADAGMTSRVGIRAHDYRTAPFPGPVDAVLISNVLRGETEMVIDDMLGRVRQTLVPDGRLLITDLFPEDAPADPGLQAALFGLHVPDGANYTLSEMCGAVTRAGFTIRAAERLPRAVVMNALVQACRSH